MIIIMLRVGICGVVMCLGMFCVFGIIDGICWVGIVL